MDEICCQQQGNSTRIFLCISSCFFEESQNREISSSLNSKNKQSNTNNNLPAKEMAKTSKQSIKRTTPHGIYSKPSTELEFVWCGCGGITGMRGTRSDDVWRAHSATIKHLAWMEQL
jgi:hypothetical protein